MYSSIACIKYGTALFEIFSSNFIHNIRSCLKCNFSLRWVGAISLDFSSILSVPGTQIFWILIDLLDLKLLVQVFRLNRN